jgi:hypothetical protein
MMKQMIINCEHEMDLNEPIEWGDYEDMSMFNHQACFWMRCKFCGCKGLCVDDTGDFWVDPETGKLDV